MELTHEQRDTQCAYKATLRRLNITIVAVTKKEVLDFVGFCICILALVNLHSNYNFPAPYYITICGLPACP